MRRRDLTTSLLLAALAWPAWAQQVARLRQRHIAIVSAAYPAHLITEEGTNPAWRKFYVELRRLGYVEGKNLAIERFSAEGNPQRYTALAGEIVKRKPDLIVSENNYIALALRAATTAIPIVSWMGDPLRSGIVTSLAHPGGNITGVSVDAGLEIVGKRFEILKEAVPSATKVAYMVLRNALAGQWDQIKREAASRLRIEVIDLPVDESAPEEYRRLFTEAVHERADALYVGPSPEFMTYRQIIVELAEKYRLPTMYCYPDFVTVGGLMAYGPDLTDLGRQLAEQVYQILSGSKPNEIPVYQAVRFPLVLNLKAARAIEFTFPPALIDVADKVVE